MDTETHTFPMPETETHKLEELQHEIAPEQKYPQAVKNFVTNYHWPLLAVAAVAGAAIGLFLKERQ